jgi:inhibitor of KinA sporulation pathway (predicted exonuclease)
VIEFPSVIVDIEKKIILEDKFQVFVKPSKNPVVSKFCFDLTGITQAQVDNGISFPDALKQHTKFMDAYRPYIICTCGDWDLKTMLPIEEKIHDLKIPGPYRRWINIKKAFAEVYGAAHWGGMPQMLQFLKLELEGRHHSGIDDCRNIARIALQMLKDGWTPK